jgi:hypothetical protein
MVAFVAEASRVVDPVSVAPFEGRTTLVVGGLLTVKLWEAAADGPPLLLMV